MAGGGVHGKVVGIVHIIITGAGVIIEMFRAFILMLTRVGEDTTETVTGTDTGGTINGFPSGEFNKTGGAGIVVDIGKGEVVGASRTINPHHNNRDSN